MGPVDLASARSRRARLVGDLERLYCARLLEFRRVAAAVSGSRESAPDVVQEAFVRALRDIGQFRGDGPLEGWVWRIVVNVARNYRRDHHATSDLTVEHEAPDSGEVGAGAVAAAVRSLPERQRLVLFLRYYADLDYEAIAVALDIASGTVGATLTAARSALAQALSVKEAAR
jgi:RNA polymerase sigma-70 factor, ECF subfamily